ncbi:N-acetylglucosamine-6-phosphate deacetylase [Weissella sagaensis]|jgi:N-acetylglucosamine-6-phosphate deacetylase|uniref:N-acetylglucosamine-6-phosphate deacetylase n=1 Tax=Weissella sagaensis TaxID=2559928 RepID=A0ABW1RSP1_9LACO|nr:N-acetylglucosamine-6-phosphate deacetylase [Weissella sagaensis]KAA8434064.1 N-acetylglucosamine-6-phosphate deacetylase [Weissella paramesenteroides]MBU7568021.1 N-acetylglucosamine-6-phosphate deacetylase [Weissella hellenica]KAA8438166.1 N-acetylglucosamine-6-phosphate deacetylase [Weissella paramesenteroides]QDJ58308.1 N-acetylglucosamine-6-phosphate deacetylase [Weissella hellenica]QEA57300.1 N-acetylglucosamine-6-phosphate deacetylase [Weissella hellenica]
MSKVLTHATIYTGNDNQPLLKDAYIRFDKQIEAIGMMAELIISANDQVIRADRKVIVPGFIDVHTHGAYGFDTMDGNAQDVVNMVHGQISEGITSVFPTTMTQSVENISNAMVAINEAAKQEPAIVGVHLEGPFINPHFKGAQPEQYIIAPSQELVQKWHELSGNRVRLITYAPEQAANVADFENYLAEHNIIGSIGHSNATREFLQQHSKASHITHLYNAQRPMAHREPGVTGHAMLEDNIRTELIVDGFHVYPDMVNLAYKLKSARRIDLITDSMRAKGLGDGESELGGQKVWVKDKQARLADGTLAGSVLEFDDAFRNIMAFTGATVHEAIQMASVNQAVEFGLTTKGTLEEGKDADLNVFSADFSELTATYSMGRRFSKQDGVQTKE